MKGQSLTAEVITGCYIKCDTFYERDMLKKQGNSYWKSWGEIDRGGNMWPE